MFNGIRMRNFNRPLPVLTGADIPGDLVPPKAIPFPVRKRMKDGEKNEYHLLRAVHHLEQNAIADDYIIPVPEVATISDEQYYELYPVIGGEGIDQFPPPELIRESEQEEQQQQQQQKTSVEYDADDEDERWLAETKKTFPLLDISLDHFETIMEWLESGETVMPKVIKNLSDQRWDFPQLLLVVSDYWRDRKRQTGGKPLMPTVQIHTGQNQKYVVFRQRQELLPLTKVSPDFNHGRRLAASKRKFCCYHCSQYGQDQQRPDKHQSSSSLPKKKHKVKNGKHQHPFMLANEHRLVASDGKSDDNRWKEDVSDLPNKFDAVNGLFQTYIGNQQQRPLEEELLRYNVTELKNYQKQMERPSLSTTTIELIPRTLPPSSLIVPIRSDVGLLDYLKTTL